MTRPSHDSTKKNLINQSLENSFKNISACRCPVLKNGLKLVYPLVDDRQLTETSVVVTDAQEVTDDTSHCHSL